MKKGIISAIVFFFSFLTSALAIELDIYSENALLYNLDEQTVLYEKGSKEEIPIASLTKIMTAIVAIEHAPSLDTYVTITPSDLKGLKEANASVAGFYVGQIVTIRDLLYGLLLPSGADAASTLTRIIAGGKEQFVNLMNEKAQELNLTHTHFVNETGLDAEGHYSTLEEVKKIFEYALQNEELKKIMESQNYTISDSSMTVKSTVFKNIDRYHLSLDYLLGGKTGTTDNAGLCLASIARDNGTNYMLITAKAPYDHKTPYNFYDAKTIYDYFIANYEQKNVIEKNDLLLALNTEYAKEDVISFYAPETTKKYVSKTFQNADLTYDYQGIEVIPFHTKVGTKLGDLKVLYEGTPILSLEILLETHLHFDLWKYIQENWTFCIVLILGMILLLFLLIKIYRKAFLKR